MLRMPHVPRSMPPGQRLDTTTPFLDPGGRSARRMRRPHVAEHLHCSSFHGTRPRSRRRSRPRSRWGDVLVRVSHRFLSLWSRPRPGRGHPRMERRRRAPVGQNCSGRSGGVPATSRTTIDRRPVVTSPESRSVAGPAHGLRRGRDEPGEFVLAETLPDRVSPSSASSSLGLVERVAGDPVDHVVAGGVGLPGGGLAQTRSEDAQEYQARVRVALEEAHEVGRRDRLHDHLVHGDDRARTGAGDPASTLSSPTSSPGPRTATTVSRPSTDVRTIFTRPERTSSRWSSPSPSRISVRATAVAPDRSQLVEVLLRAGGQRRERAVDHRATVPAGPLVTRSDDRERAGR